MAMHIHITFPNGKRRERIFLPVSNLLSTIAEVLSEHQPMWDHVEARRKNPTPNWTIDRLPP